MWNTHILVELADVLEKKIGKTREKANILEYS